MNKYDKALNCILAHVKTFHLLYEISSFEKVEYERSKSLMWELLRKYKQLEKATPKKVIVNGIREGRQINTVSFICPSCEKHIGRDNFCKHCGQELDWSQEEEYDWE